MKKMTGFLLALALPAGFCSAMTHSRAYQWGFSNGNLAANWSFENPLDTWIESPATGIAVNSHLKAAGTPAGSAKTGSFVASVTVTSSGAGTQSVLYSNLLPVNPSVDYTLSFYYKTNGSPTAVVAPVILWTSALDAGPTAIVGSTLGNASNWKLVVFNFTTPSNASYVRIVPARYGNSGTSGTFYFDDIMLDEGSLDSNTIKANRQNVSEAVAFGDAFGRVQQAQAKATVQGDWYTVTGSGFDNFARPETTFLATPYHISTPTLQSSLLSGAQSYYANPDSAFKARGYPFSRVQYHAEVAPRISEAATPDSAWQIGLHSRRQNYYFVNDTLVPANIENPSDSFVVCKYRLDWTRSPDSTYTLTWTNKLGQVVRSASNITKNTSSATNWKWAGNRFKYHPDGNLRKSFPPLDDSSSNGDFTEVSEFNSQGQAISQFGPDRNQRKFWYNRLGQLRYSQNQGQRSSYEFTYHEYDSEGRLISEGTQSIVGVTAPPQDSVDLDAYNAGTKVEEIGYIYDDTAGFQARTGFSLLSIMGLWKDHVDLHNSSNRLFCKYHKNPDNTLSGFSAQDKFIADFFTYDDHGRVTATWKYIGPERDATKRLQDCWYTYDDMGRVGSFINYVAADSSTISIGEAYHYDFMGRVDSIADVTQGKPLAHYRYLNWGPLREVILGGTASHDSAAYVKFNYHSQGGLDSITVTSHYSTGLDKIIFQQFLGYDAKALNASGVPSLIKAKYDGSISQQVYKYTNGINSLKPVRAVNYHYDQLGRMDTAQAWLNTNGSPLNSNESINTGTLAMAATDTLSTLMRYDLNSRITWQRSAGTAPVDTATYSYKPTSYELDKVTGKLSAGSTRNMSATGTFAYDSNGAMVQDQSKKLRIEYGWDGLPFSFTIDSLASKDARERCCTYNSKLGPQFFKVKYPSLSQYNFYDADGNRVSRVEAESKPTLRTRSTNYVYIGPGMVKEWREEYYLAGRIKNSFSIVSVFGLKSQIGRIRPDGQFEFFVKNHLGSTIRTVDDRGRYDSGYSAGRIYDYLAYGSNKLLKAGADTNDVTQKFTGKEFEALTGLYAFGARWYDAELGKWLSPDPANVDHDPYSYVSANPINLTDPNGLWPCIGYDDLSQHDAPGLWCITWSDQDGAGIQLRNGKEPDGPIREDGTDLDPQPDPNQPDGTIICTGHDCFDAITDTWDWVTGSNGSSGEFSAVGKAMKANGQKFTPGGGGANGSNGSVDAGQKYMNAFPGSDLSKYDANRMGSMGGDFGAVSQNDIFRNLADDPASVILGEVKGASFILVPGEGEAELAEELAINPKILDQLEKQLAKDGPASIQKSLRSAEKTLRDHIEKLPYMKYKSQVEGTIKNVSTQIRTLQKFIKDKGL
jgi:RHS repeat-associated protein